MTGGKHTPGPWLYEHDDDNGTMTIWAGSAIEDRHTGMYDSAGEMELYTSVYEEDGEHFVECEANARLIAAAPDLLEAGEQLHAAMVDLLKAYAAVQEHYGLKPESSAYYAAARIANRNFVGAIAKAKGAA